MLPPALCLGSGCTFLKERDRCGAPILADKSSTGLKGIAPGAVVGVEPLCEAALLFKGGSPGG